MNQDGQARILQFTILDRDRVVLVSREVGFPNPISAKWLDREIAKMLLEMTKV